MKMKIFKKLLTGRVVVGRVATAIVACAVFLAISCAAARAGSYRDAQSSPTYAPQGGSNSQGQPSAAPLTPQQLQELVAPIALYPDALVAQILAACAYPTQIVEAERFLQQNPGLKGKDLGAAVDQQDWDPSVKALMQFPSVLANLDKNLNWTSELGDANVNQSAAVMDAVQYMRQKAQGAGNLKSTPQQVVTDQDSNIAIQPADPQVVYVPEYDPELIYGYPVGLWPGFYPWWGPGPYLSFGIGFGVGPFFGYGWGWNAWGFDWRHRGLLYGGGRYGYHSRSFYNRNAYFRGNMRGNSPFGGRGDRGARGFAQVGREGGGARGLAQQGGRSGSSPRGAFGGVSRGGDARGQAARGRSSFGGGGGARSGGGGARAGGGARGGGGRH